MAIVGGGTEFFLPITIYSNDGSKILFAENVALTGAPNVVKVTYDSLDSSKQGCTFWVGSIEHASMVAWYVYEGSGWFQGLASTPNSDTAEESPFTISNFPIELYVVDGTAVRVRLGANEDNEPIIKIGVGRTGVIVCKNQIIPDNVYIQVPSYTTGNIVEVLLGDKKILEIPSGQTGVLVCRDKIMPDDICIVVPAEEGD